MRSKIIPISFLVAGLLCLWQSAVLSQAGASTTAQCRDKQQVQFLLHGDPLGGDTSQVKCVVDYWICGKPYSQSRVVKNGAGACDSFVSSVKNNLPKEVCCDCYPNCGDDNRQPQKQDCCNQVQQLEQQVKQLEDRIKQLEDKLNGDDITLGSGPSNIRISNKKGSEEVSINSGGARITLTNRGVTIGSSGDVTIKADQNINLKGQKVNQN